MWLSTSNESALFQHSLVALLKNFFLKSTHGHDHHQGHTFGCLTLRSKICVFLIPITNFYCLKMARPSYRSQSNVTRSIPPPCSIHGIWVVETHFAMAQPTKYSTHLYGDFKLKLWSLSVAVVDVIKLFGRKSRFPQNYEIE